MARLSITILYEDAAVVAVNKPAGLASIPGRGEQSNLLQDLAHHLHLPSSGESDPRLRVVHRLDKDTSGVMLFAKTIEAQRALSHQFQNNTVQKEYLALVLGRPLDEQGEIDAPIAPDRQRVGQMMIHKRGKPAKTSWRIEERFRGLTLMRAFPKTGKTHQIRVHLKYIGHPLAVDELYCPARGPHVPGESAGIYLSQYKKGYQLGRFATEKPLIGRLTLHAERLTFSLPGGKSLTISAPLPKDFVATLNMLRKYARV